MVHSMSRERKMNRMDDLISRQTAIDAVSRGCQAFGIFAECEKNLNALPSAERHGRWITEDKGHYFYDWKCSVCGGSGRADYLFCPRCGARMDEVEE